LLLYKTRLKLIEKRMHDEKRIDLTLGEPQPRKIEFIRCVFVPAPRIIEGNGGAQAVPHIFQVALELRQRDLERIQNLAPGRWPFPPEQVVELVDPLHLTHAEVLVGRLHNLKPLEPASRCL
jgi:hypothetical protein